MAEKAKKHGLLALEPDVKAMDDPFVRQGVELVVDGVAPNYIKRIMEKNLEAYLAKLKARYGMVIEGVTGLQRGDNPRLLRECLKAFNAGGFEK
jgi:chemotaxis protein MotA